MDTNQILFDRKNDMGTLLKKYPNYQSNLLFYGNYYLLILDDDSIVLYDCCLEAKPHWMKLRGRGYWFKKSFIYPKSAAKENIHPAPSGLWYEEIKTLYHLTREEYDMMTSMIRCDNVMIHKIIQSFEPFINSDEVCRYFCTPSFDVIVKVKPFGFELNPQWCAASAAYDAIEELTLVGNNYSNSTWWYHPGRMYFSKVKWVEIKEEDYELAKSYIIEKDNEIFSHINDIINT